MFAVKSIKLIQQNQVFGSKLSILFTQIFFGCKITEIMADFTPPVLQTIAVHDMIHFQPYNDDSPDTRNVV
jgi:hypothetical protein